MASSYMMALGEYRFSIDTAAYQQLQRTTEYRWQSQARVGRLPAQQYVGPGIDNITLNGVIHPYYKGGLKQLDAMRAEAGKGKPLHLTDGLGHPWQQWVITHIEEAQDTLFKDGTPQKITFRIQLTRYGEDF